MKQKPYEEHEDLAERIAKAASRGYPTDWQDVKQELLIGLWKAPEGKSDHFYRCVMNRDAADYMEKEKGFYERMVWSDPKHRMAGGRGGSFDATDEEF